MVIRGKRFSRTKRSIVANEYGYKGQDVAKYLRKDTAVITRYLKGRNNLRKEAERLFKLLKEQQMSIGKSDPSLYSRLIKFK